MNLEDSIDKEEINNKSASSLNILSFYGIPVESSVFHKQKKEPFSWIGGLVLFFSILGLSSNAPFINMYGDVNTFTKNLWRWQMNFLIIIPFVAQSVYYEPKNIDYRFMFSIKGISMLFLSGVLFTGASSSFIASTKYTITSHSCILSSLAGVIIIIWKTIFWYRVHHLEKYGTLVVIIGSLILMADANALKTGDQEVSILGEILALCCAGCYAWLFPLNNIIIQKIPGIVIFMCTSFWAFILFFLINAAEAGINPSVFFSMDPHVGLFGWISSENWKLSVFLVAPFWGLCGNGGGIVSLKYFEPHIVGNSLLFTPIVGQFLGCILGQDQIPGSLTFVGIIIVIGGILFVAKGSNSLNIEDVTLNDFELNWEKDPQ